MAPDPLVTLAFTKTSLPIDVSVTTPEPFASTEPPIISMPLAVRLMEPFAEVVVTPPVVDNTPVWLTTIWPPASLIPVIVSRLD